MNNHFNERPAAQAAVTVLGLYALLGIAIFGAIFYVLLKGAAQ